MGIHRHFRRISAPSARSLGWLGLFALASLAFSGDALAQSEQDIRCMQLQQEMAAARGGGGLNGAELADLDQQIAQQDRIFQGTQASMDNAGCYERLFIFGRALKRTPQCLSMNNRMEDARRQLARLQEQRKSLQRGGGNRRRQAELQQALQRNGCSGASNDGGGGLFDFFGGPREPEYQSPIYRSINPNGRYRSVCVRLCDGFYYPVSYSTYGSRLSQDAEACQANCAAPAELYVYRNPGQEIEQAISLQGSAYMDLPVALRYRQEYVGGCSCKQSEYNPTKIEAANKKAQAEPATTGAAQANAAGGAPAPAQPAATAPDLGEMPELDLDITGSTEPPEAAPAAEPAPQAAPAPPAAAQAPAAAEAPAAPPPQGQSTIIKKPRAAVN